ncbi:MAG: DUF11 domain-containing protein, partial [Phycisphaerales bacterium]|nr:DUF11 domain-containing protein [Phycisphaerales bacterium]
MITKTRIRHGFVSCVILTALACPSISIAAPRGIDSDVNLAISKTDGVVEVLRGQVVTYTIIVDNIGTARVIGASITDAFPAELTDVTYTSVATAGASGNTASGAGDINDTVDMDAGSSITYTVTATISSTAEGDVTNTAVVDPGPQFPDSDTTDNSATDVDQVITADLSITKDDGVASVMQGAALSYTIIVENAGPFSVVGATIMDTLPSSLTNISYTSSATGGATGNTAAGSGDINDTVDMPVGSTITYIVTTDVMADATGTVVNTATVEAPMGVVEPDLTNNTATDSAAIIVPEPEPEPEPEPQPTPCVQGIDSLNLLF